MRALFCYDGPLKEDSQGQFYGIALNNDLFSRYFNIADQLEVLIRVQKAGTNEDLSKYSMLNIEKMKVTECPNLSSLGGVITNRKQAAEIISRRIGESDIVIARLPSQIGNLAVRISKLLNKPCLIELVGCPWDSMWNHSVKGKLIAPFFYANTKVNIKEATHVIYVTEQYLQKKYPTNGVSTNCSNVSLKGLDELVLTQRVNKINEMNAGKLVLGTIGAVDVTYKGQLSVIRALSLLKKTSNVEFEYHLVGGGDSSHLKRKARKYGVETMVKFLGAIPHREVFKFLDDIDIYVQPSKTEGLPRSLIEAMSRGVPCIGTRVGGIPELLESDCLVNSDREGIYQLQNLLQAVDKQKMISQATRNFEKSLEYNKYLIENRRISFMKDFILGIARS